MARMDANITVTLGRRERALLARTADELQKLNSTLKRCSPTRPQAIVDALDRCAASIQRAINEALNTFPGK